MAKNVELLLVENVEALGIVGDVVKVRTGYARNYLLPRKLATQPSEELIKSLAAKRADVERQLAELRRVREQMIEKMQGLSIETIRSCNDLGVLYAAVTQQELAALLNERGFAVKPRDVRLAQTMKRVGTYEFHVRFDSDLDAVVRLEVKPDRKLDIRGQGEEGEEPAGAVAAAASGGGGMQSMIPEETTKTGWGSKKAEAPAEGGAEGEKKGKGKKGAEASAAADGEKKAAKKK